MICFFILRNNAGHQKSRRGRREGVQVGGELNEPDDQSQRFPEETLQPINTIEPTAASTNALKPSD